MQLDAERLRDLRIFSDDELREIGEGAIRAIAQALDVLDDALVHRNLVAAGEAAHRARNETLLLGARELGEALGSAEVAAREGSRSGVGEAAAAARELWPSTREAIEHATHGVTG